MPGYDSEFHFLTPGANTGAPQAGGVAGAGDYRAAGSADRLSKRVRVGRHWRDSRLGRLRHLRAQPVGDGRIWADAGRARCAAATRLQYRTGRHLRRIRPGVAAGGAVAHRARRANRLRGVRARAALVSRLGRRPRRSYRLAGWLFHGPLPLSRLSESDADRHTAVHGAAVSVAADDGGSARPQATECAHAGAWPAGRRGAGYWHAGAAGAAAAGRARGGMVPVPAATGPNDSTPAASSRRLTAGHRRVGSAQYAGLRRASAADGQQRGELLPGQQSRDTSIPARRL